MRERERERERESKKGRERERKIIKIHNPLVFPPYNLTEVT